MYRKYPKISYLSVILCVALVFIVSIVCGDLLRIKNSTAQELGLPVPGSLLLTSNAFDPINVSGLKIYPEQPFRFDFLVDPGQSQLSDKDRDEQVKRMIRYFMAALTVPESEMWVNLSPYEEDRVIADSLSVTEMGRELLAQDYILKQLTASLTHPETLLGKNYWNSVGTTFMPSMKSELSNFHKIWIVPEKAKIYQNGNDVHIIDSHLKVMLEDDYLALKLNKTPQAKRSNDLSSEVMREVIVPEIQTEVNNGKLFASLRQISQATILATWYKQNIKQSIVNKIYSDKTKIKGLDLERKEVVDRIYDLYVSAFKKGAYDFIKKEYDPSTESNVKRRYFSGGITNKFDIAIQKDISSTLLNKITNSQEYVYQIEMKSIDKSSSSSTVGKVLNPRRLDFVRQRIAEYNIDIDKLSPLSRRILESEEGFQIIYGFYQKEYDRDFDRLAPAKLFYEYIPLLENSIKDHENINDILPHLKYAIDAYNIEQLDMLFYDFLPLSQKKYHGSFDLQIMLRLGLEITRVLTSQEAVKSFIYNVQNDSSLDIAKINSLLPDVKSLAERDLYESNLLVYWGSLLSADTIRGILSSTEFSLDDKYAFLIGFSIVNDELKDELIAMTQKNRFKFNHNLHLLSLANIQTRESLEFIGDIWKFVFTSTEAERLYKPHKYLRIFNQWSEPELHKIISSDDSHVHPVIVTFVVSRNSSFYQKHPEKLDEIKINFDTYTQIIETLETINVVADDPALTQYVRKIFEAATVSVNLSAKHGLSLYTGEIEWLESKLRKTLLNLPDGGLIKDNHDVIKRLISYLPISSNKINELRDLAIELDQVVFRYDNPYGFIRELRDGIHNSASPKQLFQVKQYLHYLNTGDDSGLRGLKIRIKPEDVYSYQDLSEDPDHLVQVKTVLEQMVEVMEVVYLSGGTSFKQVLTDFDQTSYTNNYYSKKFNGLLPLSVKLDELMEGTMTPKAVFDGFNIASKLRKEINESLESELNSNVKVALYTLDNQLDSYVYRLVAETEEIVLKNNELSNLLVVLLELSLNSFTEQQLKEANVIKDELTRFEINKEPLRAFSLLGRINRLLVQYSEDVSFDYQPIVDYMAGRNQLYDRERLKDFSAELIRVENPFQVSRILHKIQMNLIDQMGLSWLVVRPGRAQGRLVYVDDRSKLQDTINSLEQSTIIITESISDDISLNKHVKGVFTKEEQGVLSHIAIRSDNNAPVVLAQAFGKVYDDMILISKQENDVNYIIDAQGDNVSVHENSDVVEEVDETTIDSVIELVEADLTVKELVADARDYSINTVGSKAYSLKRLQQWIDKYVEEEGVPESINLQVPKSVSLPFGFYDKLLASNGSLGQQILQLREELQRSDSDKDSKMLLTKLQDAIQKLEIDQTIVSTIVDTLGADHMMVRLSTNVEDLSGNAAAGIYESFENVSRGELIEYIKQGYMSLYTMKAYQDRKKHGFDETKVHAAVIFQTMINSEHSFVAHTQDPTLTAEESKTNMIMELVKGLGKALVDGNSDLQGSPHRFRYDLVNNVSKRLAYANKSYAYQIDANNNVVKIINDYSSDRLNGTNDHKWLDKLFLIVNDFGKNEQFGRDIEGAIIHDNGINNVYLLQDRDQVTYIKKDTKASSLLVKKTTGGIDLDYRNVELEISGDDIEFASFTNDVQFNSDDFEGFTFKILNVDKVVNTVE